MNLINLPIDLIHLIVNDSSREDHSHTLPSSENTKFLLSCCYISPDFLFEAQKRIYSSPAIYSEKGIKSLLAGLDAAGDRLSCSISKLAITRGKGEIVQILLSRLTGLKELTLVGGNYDSQSFQGLTSLRRLDLMSVSLELATEPIQAFTDLEYVRLGYLTISATQKFFTAQQFPLIALESYDLDSSIISSLAPSIQVLSLYDEKPLADPARFTSLQSIQFRGTTACFAHSTLDSLPQVAHVRIRAKLDWHLLSLSISLNRMVAPALEVMYIDSARVEDKGIEELMAALESRRIRLEFLDKDMSFESWSKMLRVTAR